MMYSNLTEIALLCNSHKPDRYIPKQLKNQVASKIKGSITLMMRQLELQETK